MIAYKLMTLRKDGSLGPLFINRKQRLEVGVVYPAENHPTKGYKERQGWHCCFSPRAPHLSMKGRIWVEVGVYDVASYSRPAYQGGDWLIAQEMFIRRTL